MTSQYKDIGLTEYSNQQELSALKLKTQFIKDSCHSTFHLSTAIETEPDETLNFMLKKRSITSHPPVLIWDILDHESCARRLIGLLISLIKNIL